jgi:dethiobiotin synthetase
MAAAGMLKLGVTGTDTGVGKTTVSCAILALLREEGLRVAAMKPVETGVTINDPTRDATLLARAAGEEFSAAEICPYTLPDPVAPWVAATRAGATIDPATLDAYFARLTRDRDAVVVEGAGGALVPVTASISILDLFVSWELELLVVAANRLGAINHTLLTVAAIRAAGARIRGIVLTPAAAADSGDLAISCNPGTLRSLLADVPIFEFPRVAPRSSASALAQAARSAGLTSLMNASALPHT